MQHAHARLRIKATAVRVRVRAHVRPTMCLVVREEGVCVAVWLCVTTRHWPQHAHTGVRACVQHPRNATEVRWLATATATAATTGSRGPPWPQQQQQSACHTLDWSFQPQVNVQVVHRALQRSPDSSLRAATFAAAGRWRGRRAVARSAVHRPAAMTERPAHPPATHTTQQSHARTRASTKSNDPATPFSRTEHVRVQHTAVTHRGHTQASHTGVAHSTPTPHHTWSHMHTHRARSAGHTNTRAIAFLNLAA
jgi:hypothetical protein